MKTIHLMTQRGQPYGSERKCCEMCGSMLIARPDSYWRHNVWTDEPDEWKDWPAEGRSEAIRVCRPTSDGGMA